MECTSGDGEYFKISEGIIVEACSGKKLAKEARHSTPSVFNFEAHFNCPQSIIEKPRMILERCNSVNSIVMQRDREKRMRSTELNRNSGIGSRRKLCGRG